MAHSSQLVEYLVCFNTLVSRVVWGKAALHFQFYDRLPDHLKDCLGLLGKPDSLQELVCTTQCFDNLYWERQEEWKLARSRDNRPTGGPALKMPTSGGGQQPNRCRRGETQSHAPNQPNQIHTTPDTEPRRSRTKKKPRQTSCIWFNRQPILLQSSPIKLSSQSLSPKLSEPNSITKTLILDS